jgi:hypothetical protein
MKKTKKYVLLGLIFFGITFVLTNCSEDVANETISKKNILDLVWHKTATKNVFEQIQN